MHDDTHPKTYLYTCSAKLQQQQLTLYTITNCYCSNGYFQSSSASNWHWVCLKIYILSLAQSNRAQTHIARNTPWGKTRIYMHFISSYADRFKLVKNNWVYVGWLSIIFTHFSHNIIMISIMINMLIVIRVFIKLNRGRPWKAKIRCECVLSVWSKTRWFFLWWKMMNLV